MEGLIKNADFFHNDEDKLSEYNDKVDDWRSENEENVKGSQLLSALDVLSKKLTKGKCPKYGTEGWTQANDIYDNLIRRVASELMDNEKLKPDDMRTAYYKLYIDWLKHGPATVQLEIMENTFSDSDIDMEGYMQSLKGPPRADLIAAIRTPINKTEDTDDDVFYENHREGMNRFIGNAFDKSTLMDSATMKLWLDYAFSLYLDYLHLDDNSTEHLMQEADDRFSEVEDKWEAFLDVKCLKSLFAKIIQATKTPGFPKSEQTVRVVTQPIAKLGNKLVKVGEAERYSDSIFDLLEALSVCKGDSKYIVEIAKEVLEFFERQDRGLIKAVAPRFSTFLEKADMKILQESRCCYVIVDRLLDSYDNNKNLVNDWVGLIVPLLKRPCYNTIRAAKEIMDCDEQIIWKEHKEIAKEVFKFFAQAQLPTDDNKSTEKFIKEFKSCVTYFVRGLKKARILKEFGEGLMFLGMNLLELKLHTDELFKLVEEIGENIEINVKDYKTQVMEIMRRMNLCLKDENLPWNESWELQRAVEDMLKSIIEPVNDGRIFDDNDLKMFVSMCDTCLSKDAFNPRDAAMSAHFSINQEIMTKLIDWMASTNRLGQAARLIPMLMSKFEEDDEQFVNVISCQLLNAFAMGDAATMTSSLEQLIKIYLDKGGVNILIPINTIYPFNPTPMTEYFQEMLHKFIETRDPETKTWMAKIFMTSSRKQPELFTETNMKDIVEKAKTDSTQQTTLIQITQEVSKRKPDRMTPHIGLLMDKTGWDPTCTVLLIDIITTLTLHDTSQANKVIDHFVKIIETNPHDKGVMLTALNSIRLVGFKYPDIIQPRRAEIVNLPITDVDGQTLKQTVLDMIDGKTPDDLRKQMEEQQAALSVFVDKVEEVEVAVIAVKDGVDQQGQRLDNVDNKVKEQGQKLEKVEETVEDTVAKVEEIDSKHDWRLLSSRLGYSNADIRGWAQQADPCMAMLNEWYATRKTSEASYAVLTNLQEMNRMDAALIVENAMKKAEAVVEDEEFEYASPPEIFISYQWGHQEEVKLLHRHLAMAGYDCWMDIGQMGGGDKLFEKIDNGMRAAKLVISCVTTQYAKSPNCNREVTLAVGVKKPIIPLLLENCSWPPPGSMGPIFSESLYIQFFQTGQEETNDDRYWPVDKFQELLMQLSANGMVPDEGKIDKVYRNWWMPLEAEIKIDKSKTRNGGKQVAVAQSENKESEESPDVFISYQWGKQKNIIKLYQRLTSLGFSCWLDIKQMGGGDSLYDKIDRGIRGSKVVVSCVTKKYSLSPNCRREVSLTDALKKPMVPLLLEDMTWPPSGPMSMVMTQLLYIGFQQESAHTDWEGLQFDELVNKINKHVPNVSTHQSSNPRKNNSQPQSSEKKSTPQSPPMSDSSSKGKPSPTQSPPAKQKTDPSPEVELDSQAPSPASSNAAQPSEPQKTAPPKSKSCSIL